MKFEEKSWLLEYHLDNVACLLLQFRESIHKDAHKIYNFNFRFLLPMVYISG
ncbi:hypothetical protein BHE74_00004050 [Ensete ventricosum]|nr:hypothetical protein GW17_00022776 [Ensete ventricosum]RWW87137.1 hypothetical protein BHE74_00004050 [Ensete ventricosum]RZR79638.1 hypothetical protein BHM03_00005417 [Ensete ventricosum]